MDKHSAVDVFTIDLSGKSSFADFMIVASGTSQRHVCALAEHIRSELSIQGLKGITIEGLEQGDWVLLDLGDVIVHLFRPEVR
ncbi:MAG: ribosome silencing factor, partial [Alphaproteobacteria bacterium]|nr:ribosome silencing factor [Alphaproteobacteria bacterium]